MNLYHELGLNVQSPGLVVACTQWSNPCRNAAVVRVQVIRHARAHDVGKSQSCMIFEQSPARRRFCCCQMKRSRCLRILAGGSHRLSATNGRGEASV